MSNSAWKDKIVGDRMTVDQEFTDRVQESQFSRQQWSLIMTAVELEIEGEGDDAHIVADTSKLDQIIPELDSVGQQFGGPQAGGGGSSSGGFLGSILSHLGLGGGSSEDTHRAATALANEYAAALQRHLEEEGKWERIRE